MESLIPSLFFVSTIIFSLRNESATAIPELTKPPELFLKSRIIPSTSFSLSSSKASSIFFGTLSLNCVILR